MQRAAPWLVRSGALLILVAPFLPQAESGGARLSAGSVTRALASKADGVERLAVAAALFVPLLAGAAVLAGASLPGGGPAALRLATLGLLLALSFLLSTAGSLLLTDGATRPVTPSSPLATALFAVPLLLSVVSLSRWMQGGLGSATGGFERLALALLVLLHGLILADCGWGYLLLAAGTTNPQIRLLPGAWAGPLGGLIAAAGALVAGGPPRAVVDSAPASG
jgi:hypothetical protein